MQRTRQRKCLGRNQLRSRYPPCEGMCAVSVLPIKQIRSRMEYHEGNKKENGWGESGRRQSTILQFQATQLLVALCQQPLN